MAPLPSVPRSEPTPRGGATAATASAAAQEASEAELTATAGRVVVLPQEVVLALANLQELSPAEWDNLIASFTQEYKLVRADAGSILIEKAGEALVAPEFIQTYYEVHQVIEERRPSLDPITRICLEDAFTVLNLKGILPETVYNYLTHPLEEADLLTEGEAY